MKQLIATAATVIAVLAIGCMNEAPGPTATEPKSDSTVQFSVPLAQSPKPAQAQPKLPKAPAGYQTLPRLPSPAPAGSISLGMTGYVVISSGTIELHRSGRAATLEVGPDGSVDCGELIDGMVQAGFTEAEVSSQLGTLISALEGSGIAVTNKDKSQELVADKFH